MAAKEQSLKGFFKGLISVTNRFSTPKGANIIMSNLLLNERGALQTCDGSAIVSQLPGGLTVPIVCIATYVNPNNLNAKVVALVENASDQYALYDLSTNPATVLVANIPRDPDWDHPQLFNFAGYLVITCGPASNAQIYTEVAGTPGTIQPMTSINTWLPTHPYKVGDMIDAGNGFCFQVIKAGTNFVPVQGGVSGGSPPSWPTPTTNPNTPQPFVVDNTVLWQLYGQAPLAASSVPPGSAHGISHEGFMWMFGTFLNNTGTGLDGPMSLRQSHLNTVLEWPDIYSAFVGKDDGQVATGVGSFTIAEAGIAPQGGLVLFKTFSTYNVTDSFEGTSFAITPVKTDLGCIAPRSVQFVPGFGLMRLTHMGVALYDGVQDRLVSEDIRSYFFGGFGVTGINWAKAQNARATIVSNPPMYILAIPTGSNTWCNRILCYDLIVGSGQQGGGWTVVDLPFTISSLFQARIPTALGSDHPFQIPVTYMGGATDGVVRRWQAGDTPIWDNGTIVSWSVTTPEIGSSTVGRLFFKEATIRLHAPQATNITFTPTYGSVTATPQTRLATPIGPVSQGPSGGSPDTVGTYEGDLDLTVRYVQGVTGQTERVTVSGSGRVTIESIELNIVEKPTMPLGQPV